MKKQNKKKNNTDPLLSIVVLSFNTRGLLSDCLDSLKNVKDELDFEVIVVDNGSNDGSAKMVKTDFPWVQLIKSENNLGFAGGNNLARQSVRGKFVLFLNSDTVVKRGTLEEVVGYMQDHSEIGALSCKLVLPNGELDKDVRRSFPTPWVAFTHLVLPLDRIFKNSRLFAKYWYGYLPEDKIHQVDVLQGAFFLTKKEILDDVGWYDEDYFLDGEDIDLSWKIKDAGWKIVYFPKVEVVHLKGASKGKEGHKSRVSKKEKLRYRLAGVNSMEIFYRKRLWDKYPVFINYLVLIGLQTLKLIRTVKIHILG